MNRLIIGKNIQILRDNSDFTQSNIADFLGVDQSLISKIEKGERSISSELLDKIATLFGVDVEQISSPTLELSKLSHAFRGNQIGAAEMGVIYAINKIALNSDYMHKLLQEAHGD